jgi:hypothetical protein
MIKKLAVSGAVIVSVLLPVSAAHATVDPEECQNFASPIIISQGYDPLHLDTDGDGIACEGNPGEPVKTDLYADLRGETSTPSATPSSAAPTLADTGAGNMITRHPVRSIGVGVVLVGAGAGLFLVTRRRRTR